MIDFIIIRIYTGIMKYSKRIQNRISRIGGQVGGIKKMIANEEDEGKVMTQLQAVISSLESLKLEMLKKQMRESLVEDVMKSLKESD